MHEFGTVIVIYPDNIWYTNVSLDDVEEIFDTSILNDKIVHRLEGKSKTCKTYLPFERQ